jgi:hypothetical protein
MKYDLFPKQEEFFELALHFKPDEIGVWRNSASVIAYGGGIRGGKSYAGILLFALYCKMFPGSKWIIVRKSIAAIRKTTLPTFRQIFPEYTLKSMPSQGKESPWTAIFPNGSQIMFFGENYDKDPDQYEWRGLEANGFCMEEGNELREESYYTAMTRKGSWKMNTTWPLNVNGEIVQCYPSVNIITCNPSRNWLKNLIYNKYRDGNLPKGVHFVQARATDNPHVSKAYLDEKKLILPVPEYEMMVEGDWDSGWNEKPWMYHFEPKKHVYRGDLSRLIIPGIVFISCDQNVEPPAATAHQIRPGIHHLIAESKIDRGSVYDICDWVKAKFPDKLEAGLIRVTGDASGWKSSVEARNNESFYQIMINELGIPHDYVIAPHANELLDDSRLLCNSVLKAHPHFLVHESCERTILELEGARTDAEGKLEKAHSRKGKAGEFLLDYFDTFRYMIHTAYPDWLVNHQKYL